MAATPLDMRITRFNRTLLARGIIALGEAIGRLLPVRNRSSLFFFFPFQHVGGAEKVHAEIVGCFAGEKPWVFFTKRSENAEFRPLFDTGARLLNFWPLLKYGYPLSVGIMAGLINRHEKPAVFGSNSLFYYLLLPYLRPHVRRIDLIHAFGGGAEEFSLSAAPRLDTRVVINEKSADDLRGQYLANGLDPRLAARIVHIGNRVAVPAVPPEKRGDGAVKAIFVGRGSGEKRVHLIGRAATLCRRQGIAVEFTLVGDVAGAVAAEDLENCRLPGVVTDAGTLAGIYREADLILLTSSREGFPLVLMEAMAQGVVPVSTAVGGIPLHLRDGVNGVLLDGESEEGIVAQLVSVLGRLAGDRVLLAELARGAHDYARQHFGGEGFCASYRRMMYGDDGREGKCRK